MLYFSLGSWLPVILIFIILYLFSGAMFMLVYMLKDKGDWDHFIWLMWPWVGFRMWKLYRFKKAVRRMWDD